MRFSSITTLFCAFSSVALAMPLAMPVEDGEFELISKVETMFQERFLPEELDDIHSVIQKRDTESTIESILDLVNSSGIIFDVLDLVAYSPSRIEAIANLTARAIGNFNTSSLSSFSSVTKSLNYSRMYYAVMDSGVVTSLLDGILLDEDYRPVLVKLVSRIMEGNKNLFLYLVQDIFKKSKRSVGLEKRATSSLETFIGNIVASALSSDLVGGISSDVLEALNNTQFLTYTVKELIANEGYQNMTAQLAIDIMKTGDLKINSQSINITKYADALLSKPMVVVSLVSQLLSGNINLSGLGKYTDAVKAIVKGIEDDGVFADMNNYVFSESHTVTKPLIQTNNIVVPRSGAATTTRSTSRSSSASRSSNRTAISTSNPTTTSLSSDDSESAAEVASILSVLGASTSGGSSSSSTRRSASASSSSSFDINQLLSQIGGDSSVSSRASSASSRVSSVASSVTSDGGNILSILAALGSTQNRAAEASTTSAASSSSSSSASNAALPNNFITKMLVYTQALLLGGVLLL